MKVNEDVEFADQEQLLTSCATANRIREVGKVPSGSIAGLNLSVPIA